MVLYRHEKKIVYSYFMFQQAVVQSTFPEKQVFWQAIARDEAEGNSMSSRYLHQGEKFYTIACLSLK